MSDMKNKSCSSQVLHCCTYGFSGITLILWTNFRLLPVNLSAALLFLARENPWATSFHLSRGKVSGKQWGERRSNVAGSALQHYFPSCEVVCQRELREMREKHRSTVSDMRVQGGVIQVDCFCPKLFAECTESAARAFPCTNLCC